MFTAEQSIVGYLALAVVKFVNWHVIHYKTICQQIKVKVICILEALGFSIDINPHKRRHTLCLKKKTRHKTLAHNFLKC